MHICINDKAFQFSVVLKDFLKDIYHSLLHVMFVTVVAVNNISKLVSFEHP